MPTGRLAAVLSAKAKDFRVGRNGERGEIASSPSGGGQLLRTRRCGEFIEERVSWQPPHSGNPVIAAAVSIFIVKRIIE